MTTNWAGNLTYHSSRVVHPSSVEELQSVVSAADGRRVRALGSRHSFSDVADTDGVHVAVAGLPPRVEVDESTRTATVAAGMLYGDVASALHQQGWALATMASLPHISVAGAVATGTHGSGDDQASLAAAVSAVEMVVADGSLVRLGRGDADFDGVVVSLGALGVATSVSLDVEPAYDMRVDAMVDLPWESVIDDLDAVTGAATSVSLFTNWGGETVGQVWLKSRVGTQMRPPRGALPTTSVLHMLPGGDVTAVTEQGGLDGPWHERLPHFRMSHTPSRGEELQSEYLVPRDRAAECFEVMRALAPRLAPVLQISEIRTVAADPLWLSPAYGRDVVGLHFTWWRDVSEVYAVLPLMEEALLPLGARPHWGKCFVAGSSDLEPLYPRMTDFVALRARLDPGGTFGNVFVDRVLPSQRSTVHRGG